MQKEAILQKEASGSTAVTILIKDDVLYCANAGDSRAVASINGKVIVARILMILFKIFSF